MTAKVERVISDLFERYVSRPNCLPPEWQAPALDADARGRARYVADYIAGMTDRYALQEHRKLFDIDAAT
jgi:dGTPase